MISCFFRHSTTLQKLHVVDSVTTPLFLSASAEGIRFCFTLHTKLETCNGIVFSHGKISSNTGKEALSILSWRDATQNFPSHMNDDTHVSLVSPSHITSSK